MTDTEILLLVAGIGIGAQGTSVIHMVLDMRDARRSLARSRQARRRAGADAYLNSFRLYRLQQRRPVPRPAELVEASFRDFELKLYDGLDRVEDAARRDGLL